jgi:putative PIN family toxin of toxin-antitoxin system
MIPESKPLRVVVDTNVLFSALALGKDSPPLKILELVREGKIEAAVSPFILAELENALARKAGWDHHRILELRRRLKTVFVLIEPRSHFTTIKRKDADNRILECAVDAQADVLVTGDHKDIRPLGWVNEVEILTPREFLEKYFRIPI